ncbi:hypothetical protein AKJ16_DCAP18769 [Drosera capensis]
MAAATIAVRHHYSLLRFSSITDLRIFATTPPLPPPIRRKTRLRFSLTDSSTSSSPPPPEISTPAPPTAESSVNLGLSLFSKGRGMPDWSQIVKEIPEMDTLLSKLER